MKQKRTKISADNEFLLWCRGCEEYLPIADFALNNSEFGYATKCLNCSHTQRPRTIYINTNEKKLSNERIAANQVLEKLGYDLQSEETIHQQFLRRHNL